MRRSLCGRAEHACRGNQLPAPRSRGLARFAVTTGTIGWSERCTRLRTSLDAIARKWIAGAVRVRFQFNRFNAFDDVDRDTISLLRSVSKRTAGKTHMDDSKCLRLKKRHHRIGKSESVADRVVGKYLPNDSSSANAFCSRFPTHCELSSNQLSPPGSRPLSG